MNKSITILLLISLIFLSSCYSSLLSEIPNHEFSKFEYHRAGNTTSAHIIATNAKRQDNSLSIDTINISAAYGPFYDITVIIEGYKTSLEANKE